MSKHTYSEVQSRAAAGDDLAISHLAFWDRCKALDAAEADRSELHARLNSGDDRVTATMITKADAEVVRCKALSDDAHRKYLTAKRLAPKDPVLAEIVSSALESIGIPMEPHEHLPFLTVTPKDQPTWDHITGMVIGTVNVVYTSTEWHREITVEEIAKAMTSSPRAAGVHVDGAGSRFTVRLTGWSPVPAIYNLAGTDSWTWSSARQSLTGTAQTALLDRYGMGMDDWGSTGEAKVKLAGLSLKPKGEERDGDVLRRRAEVTAGVGWAKNRGEANDVAHAALLGTVGTLWSGLGVVESVEPTEGNSLLFTIVSRVKAGQPARELVPSPVWFK